VDQGRCALGERGDILLDRAVPTLPHHDDPAVLIGRHLFWHPARERGGRDAIGWLNGNQARRNQGETHRRQYKLLAHRGGLSHHEVVVDAARRQELNRNLTKRGYGSIPQSGNFVAFHQ
jgi:hypothetical protein